MTGAHSFASWGALRMRSHRDCAQFPRAGPPGLGAANGRADGIGPCPIDRAGVMLASVT